MNQLEQRVYELLDRPGITGMTLTDLAIAIYPREVIEDSPKLVHNIREAIRYLREHDLIFNVAGNGKQAIYISINRNDDAEDAKALARLAKWCGYEVDTPQFVIFKNGWTAYAKWNAARS